MTQKQAEWGINQREAAEITLGESLGSGQDTSGNHSAASSTTIMLYIVPVRARHTNSRQRKSKSVLNQLFFPETEREREKHRENLLHDL